MVQIIPNITESDRKAVEQKIALVSPYVEAIQIDIADQTLVPIKTLEDFAFLTNLDCPQILEAHLLVHNPELYVTRLVRSGFKRLIGHVECIDPREFLAEARSHECEVGLAIDIETSIEEIEPLLEEIDCVQVMTAQSGASGQLFEESSISKIKAIHRNFPELPIAVEGGMNEETVKVVVQAGATRIVTASYIFHDESRVGEAIQRLLEIGV